MLSVTDQNYDMTHHECLAEVCTILLLRPYLAGQKFTVPNDHVAVKWIFNLADLTGPLARWKLHFDIVHRTGIKTSCIRIIAT